MASPSASVGPVRAVAAAHYAAPAVSDITRQIQAFRAKVEEVIAYRTTPRHTTTAQEEKISQDSIDILEYIHRVLQQLKLPAETRNFQDLDLYDQTHMPIAINDEATEEEIAACDELIAQIEASGVNLNYSRGLASFQYITKIALTAQDQLAKNAATRDSSVESLAARQINPLEAMGLEVLLSDLENAQENITLSIKSYQDGSRNIFTREAEGKFLEVVHQTNAAALAAIAALGSCIDRQLSTAPTEAAGELLRGKLSNLSTRAHAVFDNLNRNHILLNPPMHAAYARSAARGYAGAADDLDAAATPPSAHVRPEHFGGGAGRSIRLGGGGGYPHIDLSAFEGVGTPGDGSEDTSLGDLYPRLGLGRPSAATHMAGSAPALTPASATASALYADADAVRYHGSDALPSADALERLHAAERLGAMLAAMEAAHPPLQDVVFALENIPADGRFEVRGTGPGMSWEEGIEIDVAEGMASTTLPTGEYEFKIVHISGEGLETWKPSGIGTNLSSAVFASGAPVVIDFSK